MASAQPRSKPPTDKLLRRIGTHLDPLRLGTIASDVNVTTFSTIVRDHPGFTDQQAFRVLSSWSESSAAPDTLDVIKKVRGWKKRGWVHIDVMEDIQEIVMDLVPGIDPERDLYISQGTGPRLTNIHIANISSQFAGKKSGISDFGIIGLQIPQTEIDQALKNHTGDIAEACRQILGFWLNTQDNREVAYTNMCAALEKCKLMQIAGQLKRGELD